MREIRARMTLPHDTRREVQVVVVEEHRCVRRCEELIGDCGCERGVDDCVACVPGVSELRVDARRAREVPQPVLNEPEHRIGDDVVVEGVRLGIVSEQAEVVGRPAARRLADAGDARLPRHEPVLLGNRARDPRDVVVLGKAVESRHEPPTATSRDALAGLVPPVDDGATVGDDDEAPARIGHERTVPPPRERGAARRRAR